MNENKLSFSKRFLIDLKCNLSKWILSLFPKKNNLVLLTSWFGTKYIDNTMYVYEYLLNNSDYNVVWMTKDKHIYSRLKNEGKPVELFFSLRGLLLQIRAMAVFSTVQFSDYKVKLLTNCLYIDLGHGHPIKDPGRVIHDPEALYEYSKYYERVSYYSIVASSYTKRNRQITKTVPDDHIFVSDFARNDVFFDKDLQAGKNLVIEEIKKGRKALVYMPTHRNDGKEIMRMKEILPLDNIQKICERHNWVFIIKKHYYHRNEIEDINCYSNIFDITNNPDIDPQVLLCQADALISDYSACYVDYMLLRRPILFYQYDYEDFTKNVRSLLTNFEELKIAPISYTKEQLCIDLDRVFEYDVKYLHKRMEYAHEFYFDNISHNNGRGKVKIILDSLMKNRG